MNKNVNQLAGIILLFLALIRRLGFVYWQNFMQLNPDVDIIVPIEGNLDLTEIAFTPKLNFPLSFSYSSSWVLNNEVVDITRDNMYEPILQRRLISSISGIYVALEATNDCRVGGTCDRGDMSHYYEFLKSTSVPGDSQYYYIETIINYNGYLSYHAYLQPSKPSFSDSGMPLKSACVDSGTRLYDNCCKSSREYLNSDSRLSQPTA